MAAGSLEGADSRLERDFSGEKARCGSVTTTDAGSAPGVCQRFLYRYAYELACCYYLESGGVMQLDSRGRGGGVVHFVMVSKVHMVLTVLSKGGYSYGCHGLWELCPEQFPTFV